MAGAVRDFEFAFAIVLISAARAGFASGMKDWRTVAAADLHPADLRGAGVGLRLVLAAGGYHMSHALVLGVVYFYNFLALRGTAEWERASSGFR